MKSKPNVLFFVSLVLLVCAGLLFVYETRSGVQATAFPRTTKVATKSLPRKGWTLGFHAFRMRGYRDLPVKVYGVTSAGERGLQVAHVSSKSDQIIIGVRIKWFVGEKGKPSILAKGETPLLNLPGLVGALPKFDVSVPDVSLEKILVPAMRKGQLRGDFDVQVVVSEVKYLDGSFWQLPEPTDLVVEQIKTHHGGMDLCAGQTCRLAPDLFSYQCADSKGELCVNGGDACSSRICELY